MPNFFIFPKVCCRLAASWFARALTCFMFATVALPGLAQTAVANTNQQAVILQYHHVSTTTPPITSLSIETFRLHMQYLADNNFTILPLEEVIAALRNNTPLPELTAVITFDDGYTSVYDTAFPLLREYDWPFTIFVTAGLVGSNNFLYATWDQLREMGEQGATLANHTVSHPYLLAQLASETQQQWLTRITSEITDAEAKIAAETGQNHKLLAYPYGEYSPEIQNLVRELDYVGIGQHSGPIGPESDFTALPRFPFSGIYASMTSFPDKIRSLAAAVEVLDPQSPVTNSQSPAATLAFTGEYRIKELNCYNNNVVMHKEAVGANRQTLRITTEVENRSRRFRYNCTMPGPAGRYYWYSVPWVNPSIAE